MNTLYKLLCIICARIRHESASTYQRASRAVYTYRETRGGALAKDAAAAAAAAVLGRLNAICPNAAAQQQTARRMRLLLQIYTFMHVARELFCKLTYVCSYVEALMATECTQSRALYVSLFATDNRNASMILVSRGARDPAHYL